MEKITDKDHVRLITDRVLKAAGGDNSIRIDTSGRYDEIDSLAEAINGLIQNMFDQVTERERTEVALRESEARYHAVVDAFDGLMYVCSQDYHIEFMNERFIERTGYDGTGHICYKALHGLDQVCTWCVNERVWAGETVRWEVESPKDHRWFYVSNSPIYHPDGTMSKQALILDITALKRSEDEKKRLEIQLAQSQKMEALGTLAGGISHDFNNFLATIIAYAELGIHHVSEPSLAQKNLDEVLKVCGRARDLVKQILAFSRRSKMVYVPLKLDATIKETLKMLRVILPRTIEIRQNLLVSGRVLGDAIQIQQVMMNLCTNASHAMGECGGVLGIAMKRVTVDADVEAHALDLAPGHYLMLSVSDTGEGIPPEVMERIFDPYFTTKEKGSGMGLGLSVVHGIVKSHRGTITCTSVPGEGTTFDIYLPEIGLKKEGVKPQSMTSFQTGTERVLFVDDEKILVEAAKAGLEQLGYHVIAKTGSIEALKFFQKHSDQIDLVITDIFMPVMTGDMLARELLSIRHDIPIILYTGYNELLTEEKAKKIGIREIVMKPLEINELASIVRKVLDER